MQTASRMHTVTHQRPTNCDPKQWTNRDKHPRCPECGLWHLRAGYCAALDPKSGWADLPKPWLKDVPPSPISVPLTSPDVPLSPKSVPLTSSDVPVREIVPLSYCAVCGDAFEAKRTTARYCSDKCRVKAQRS